MNIPVLELQVYIQDPGSYLPMCGDCHGVITPNSLIQVNEDDEVTCSECAVKVYYYSFYYNNPTLTPSEYTYHNPSPLTQVTFPE